MPTIRHPSTIEAIQGRGREKTRKSKVFASTAKHTVFISAQTPILRHHPRKGLFFLKGCITR